ncbi:ProQ/FINO family protein [Halomonas citrativorans]|uniref:ABC transporter substrate-binding protein n=1 Tax=Halomonas citrativorans TaxID=2742612 RepID=A0ABR9FDE6_9GAMM|nr:ProQ/FINO family protein [Halomonas citrativorans]MBE0404474.1 ABC transporter substrate-binding protein [Halomonas citrativorans]
MAASVMQLLDSLESRLEQAQRELQALRRENIQLKEQLMGQAVALDSANTSGQLSATSAGENVTPPSSQYPAEQPQSVPASSGVEAVAKTTTTEAGAQPPSPHALLKEWYQRYPNTFFKGHTKPLKVGIHQDLAAREPWSGKLIRRALANYVNLPRYLKSVREGGERIDLDGQLAGKVDKEAALHAAEKRKAKQQEGRAPARVPSTPKKAPLEESARLEMTANTSKSSEPAHKSENKTEQPKTLSLDDKLKGLQQKYKAH